MRAQPVTILGFLSVLGVACAEGSQAPPAREAGPQPGGLPAAAAAPARQISEYIVELYEDRAGNIWFGTISDGVCRYDGESFVCFTSRDGLGGGSVRGIVEDEAGDLWFATDSGVFRRDGTSFTRYTVADGLGDDRVLTVARDRRGTLWFGSDGGVTRYDGTTFSNLALPLVASLHKDFPTGNRSPALVWSILEDRSGALWFGTNGSGVIRYDGAAFTRFTTLEGLSEDFVYSIHEDRRGILWFGTSGGLSRHDGTTFTTYSERDGLGGHDVWAIVEDRGGDLWLGTGGGGVTRFDGATSFQTISTQQGLGNGHVQSLLEDSRGRLWIGTSGGAYRLDGTRAVNVTRE
ncbi:MAG TPA: two-component regulator propeller domain-containing protein [Nannocystis sp.]